MKTSRIALAGLLLSLGTMPLLPAGGAAVARQEVSPTSVDFRMAPLEQARKIYARARTPGQAGFARTVMSASALTAKHPSHMIVGNAFATPAVMRSQLDPSTGLDSLSWWAPRDPHARGACDSDAECEQETQQMCQDAGHGGVETFSVEITTHSDGAKTCSGDCQENGAVAFVTCSPSN